MVSGDDIIVEIT